MTAKVGQSAGSKVIQTPVSKQVLHSPLPNNTSKLSPDVPAQPPPTVMSGTPPPQAAPIYTSRSPQPGDP